LFTCYFSCQQATENIHFDAKTLMEVWLGGISQSLTDKLNEACLILHLGNICWILSSSCEMFVLQSALGKTKTTKMQIPAYMSAQIYRMGLIA